jgi:predicted Fe-Mo cluster-binding NifX family protein
MKIAVAVENPDPDSMISEGFGRSRYLLIHDTINESDTIITNPFFASVGGAGIETSQILIENNCDALITSSIGKHALMLLKSAGVQVFLSTETTANNALNLFREGNLNSVELNTPRHHRRKHYRKKHKGYS